MEHEVALVDDHHLMRNGLAATINAMDGYRITLEAGNGQEFIEQLGNGTRPAIAVIDLNMPVMDGFETLGWLREHAPEIRPIVLTFDAQEETMLKAVHAGARGFLLKSARPSVMRTALDSLMASGYFVDETTHDVLLRGPERPNRTDRERERLLADVTAREMEFLRLVCREDEYTYEQIAELMGVHRRTIDGYRSHLFDKFNVRSKTGLVLFALRWGLLD